MHRFPRILAGSALALSLIACGGSGSGSSSSDTPQTSLRVLHASADAPAVNVRADDATIFSELDFATATAYLSVDEGSYRVRVDGIVPGGTATVIDVPDVELSADTRYTAIAVGNVADIAPLLATVPDEDPAGDEARVQVVHAAAGAPEVDLYVTAPDTDLSSASPTASAAFEDVLDPLTVAPGDYRIRVTPAGDMTVVFDSGTVALPGGADLLIAAVDNIGPGEAPIRLVVADGDGSSVLLDQGEPAPAAVRAAHMSPDAGEVDIAVDDGPTLFANVEFPAVSDFANVEAGDYLIDVLPTGSDTPAIDNAPLSVEAGAFYSAFAVGLAAGSPDLELIASRDAIRSIATEARVRVVHAASGAGEVDVYVTGTDTGAGDLPSATPVLEAVPFATIGDFLSLAAGDYNLFVTPAGMPDSVAIEATDQTVDAGGVYTVIARDDGMGGLTVTIVDDTP